MGPRMWRSAAWVATAVAASTSAHLRAQADASVALTVQAGRPLRVVLTDTTTIHRVGQPVKGTLMEPIYAYDRIVLPVGAAVAGHVVTLENPSRWSRTRSWLSGDFSPHRVIVLEFDSVLRDGEPMPVRTVVNGGIAHVKRQVARNPDDNPQNGAVARAKQEVKDKTTGAVAAIKQRASDTIAGVREPRRMERLKGWAIDRLPYHPQLVRKGTVYDAALRAPLTFGSVTTHAPAPQGSVPAPSSILKARLVTPLDSATTPRGTPLEAIVTEPVFAEDGRLIFSEGTKLTGEVTFAQQARRLHRNGQVRFLFERVEPPEQESAPLLASLHAVDVSSDDRVVLDDEGGAAVTNSKSRFVTPALAMLAMRASMETGEGRGLETGAAGVEARTTSASVGPGSFVGRGVGGLIGFGLIGAALGQISRPLGIAFGAWGVGRSVYSNVLGKGQELRFQADTPIQVQLAPGPTAKP